MTTTPKIDVRPFIERDLVSDARWLREATSTNSILLAESPFSDTDGTYLLGADTQTAGRGRNANRWQTTNGALTFSLLLKRDSVPTLLAFRAALAVCEAADPTLPQQAQIKWPNDVLVNGCKLAGILIEQQPNVGVVIGVGINVNNRAGESDATLRQQMTSLTDHSAKSVSRSAVLTSFLERWQAWDAADDGSILEAIAERDALRGREVSIVDGVSNQERQRGLAAGLAVDGGLVIDCDGAMTTIHSGSVRLV